MLEKLPIYYGSEFDSIIPFTTYPWLELLLRHIKGGDGKECIKPIIEHYFLKFSNSVPLDFLSVLGLECDYYKNNLITKDNIDVVCEHIKVDENFRELIKRHHSNINQELISFLDTVFDDYTIYYFGSNQASLEEFIPKEKIKSFEEEYASSRQIPRKEYIKDERGDLLFSDIYAWTGEPTSDDCNINGIKIPEALYDFPRLREVYWNIGEINDELDNYKNC